MQVEKHINQKKLDRKAEIIVINFSKNQPLPPGYRVTRGYYDLEYDFQIYDPNAYNNHRVVETDICDRWEARRRAWKHFEKSKK